MSERVPEAMRIGIGQPSIGESFFENLPDRGGVAPMLSRQSNDLELPIGGVADLRRRKQRIVISPKFFLSQKIHLTDNDVANVIGDRKKASCESFAALRLNLARVLLDFFSRNVDMLQFERSRRAIARARKYHERDRSPNALFDVRLRRHRIENPPYLFACRHLRLTMSRRHAGLLFRKIEILRVGVRDARFIAGLIGEPFEKGL